MSQIRHFAMQRSWKVSAGFASSRPDLNESEAPAVSLACRLPEMASDI